MYSRLCNSAIVFCVTFFWGAYINAQEFGLPIDCQTVGVECRIQQYVDMDTGPMSSDPYCSTATYDGHDGTDIRILSMVDVAKGVPVIAMAAGTVLRVRDGEPDNLVKNDADRRAVANRECGNGVVIEHGNAQVQYCHMRQNSLVVKPGDSLLLGQKIGEVGASGMAQFPHVHITVRQNASVLDPMTGLSPNAQPTCANKAGLLKPMWRPQLKNTLAAMASPLLQAGIAGTVPKHAQLSDTGAPPPATLSDSATIGWAWFANLQKGDQVKLTLFAPDGHIFSESLTAPLTNNKADYSAYIGRKRAPTAGEWTLVIALLRAGKSMFEATNRAYIR